MIAVEGEQNVAHPFDAPVRTVGGEADGGGDRQTSPPASLPMSSQRATKRAVLPVTR
ncbi:hypothetical protein SHIRM173S_07810 [Streptomyces hirsutus]